MDMDKLFSRHHGLSSSIVLDRAPNFANHDLRILLGKLATKFYTLNSYHPQKHGQNTFENLALSTMPRIIIDPAGNSNVDESLRSTLCPVYATASSAESPSELSLRCLQM